MIKRIFKNQQILDFKRYLVEQERSENTIKKYLHDVGFFFEQLNGADINKQNVIVYKESLGKMYTPSGANSMIAALNSFFKFLGWYECCVKQFKIQKSVFASEEKEMSREEYVRLVKCAESRHNERLALLIQTICSTGMRVSELEFVTVESVKRGEINVSCKGKRRVVFIVKELRRRLLAYAKRKGIYCGRIFITRSGAAMNRCNIWREMKALCKEAGVLPSKVFPHNLRHLFARVFYRADKDIAKLADILGHSSINTTRIYIMTTGAEHRRRMEGMRLII